MAKRLPEVNPEPWLLWIKRRARIYDPTEVGKQRGRDPDDDSLLACALASNAEIIISNDEDLLDLEKPFGITILTPRDFLRLFN